MAAVLSLPPGCRQRRLTSRLRRRPADERGAAAGGGGALRATLSLVVVISLTAVGVALPVLGIDFAGDTVAKITALLVLSFVALLDLGLSRYLMLPSLRRRGLTRSSAESAGYAQIESIGVTAILTGLATDIPEAALIPGAIGIWGWTVARRYFAGWPEPGAAA